MQENAAYILIALILIFIAYKLSKILKYLKKINLNLRQDNKDKITKTKK